MIRSRHLLVSLMSLAAPALAQEPGAPSAPASAPAAEGATAAPAPSVPAAPLAPAPEALKAEAPKAEAKEHKEKWYDKLAIRGYTQVRYNGLLQNEPTLIYPQGDKSIGGNAGFLIRRARLQLLGDVHPRVYLYFQNDFAADAGTTMHVGQIRDLYADIALDDDKEYRFRVGQSKVPFGFENMQSSSNRAPIDRTEALNSATPGERELGVFFYWAPKEIREVFRQLVRKGLKGSGDYGVLGFGAYSGQGLNRSDKNGEFHWIGRASYPFTFDNGQVLELGVQGYVGNFVVSTEQLAPDTGPTPIADPEGLDDERLALSATLYPQPFGFEAEWTWGEGPELNSTLDKVEVDSLEGGYLQANCLIETSKGPLFPFVRWNYFDGARKFRANAPVDKVNEIDIGFEWSPWPELEFSIMYTRTLERTDTTDTSGPDFYEEAQDEDRLAFQLQWNY